MQNEDIRKGLGVRLKKLRKQKKWTQKELAAKLNTSFSQLNKYESGFNIPPADKLIQLSEIFDTTVDYLLTGNQSEESPLHNLRMLERFQEIEEFQTEDQEALIRIIDAMILKNKMSVAMKPFKEQKV